jgi:hypothetical protein
MKTALGNLFLLFVLGAASMTYGSVPPVNVIVSRSSGEVAFKGTTDANGTFATPSLKPGHYVVQFKAKNGAVKDSNYALVVSAGNKKVVANAVSGSMFTGGGVAMRVDVGDGLNITGNIASAMAGADGNLTTMVWVPTMPGSNMPAHWAEKGSADEVLSRTRGIIQHYSLVKMQDHTDVGSH